MVAVNIFECYMMMANISVPVFVIHVIVVKIVPYVMGKKMYELANEP